MLLLGATPPTGSTEAEKAASGIRRLKTPYPSSMRDKRESGLNLLYLQQISNIDIQNVAQMFIRMYAQKMFKKSALFED